MLNKQITIEIKKHIVFFTGLSVINITLILLSFIPKLEIISTYFYSFYQIIAFTLLIIYIYIDIFNDLYLGKNILSLMIPFGEIKLLISKSIVYITGFMMLWITSLVQTFFAKSGLYKTAIVNSIDKPEGIAYLFISRISGIFCGIAIFIMCIAFIRFIKNKFTSYIFSFIIFLTIMICLCIVVLQLNGCLSDEMQWSIGINTDVHVYNQYFGFIPIMIIPYNNFDISSTISWSNVILNFVIGALLYLISSIFLKFKRYDYLKIDCQVKCNTSSNPMQAFRWEF